ncbi:fimbrial protein [Ahniella affigens]|uniref:Fimbrial protein n=1 Tax=Ahniella affigens TaxID=2021234 RepID=A0A2P1PV62_9GAMM|nr:type 4a pilus biogenesis protein PilO [Ahniella affigens]AVP98712.1 fimbrial protein [Ahniella affigens]
MDLKNLETKNYGNWPMPIKLAACLGIFLVVLLLGYVFKIKESFDTQSKLMSEEQSLLVTFRDKQAKVVNLEDYKKQLAEMEELLRQMVRQLPSKTEMPDLLVDISQTALSSGIDTELFEPGAESPKDFYAEKPIKIRMAGTYHQFGAFVSGVASLPRVVILTMHDVSLKPQNALPSTVKDPKLVKAAANKPTGILTLEGTVKTYRYLDDDEVSGSDAAPDAGARAGGKS